MLSTMHTSNTHIKSVPIWMIVLIASLGMNISLVLVFGINDGGDSGRYYDSAEKILDWQMPTGKSRSYLGYSGFVTIFVALGLSKTAIGIAQISISAIAAVCLYLLGRRFYSARVGISAAFLFIAFPDIQYWNLIVYAESLYTSMLIISSYLLITAENPKQVLVALIPAIYTCSIRPHGVGFAVALLIYGLYLLWINRHYKLLGALALILVVTGPLMWTALGTMVKYERVLDIYAGGEITWGYKDNALEMPGEISEQTLAIDHPVPAILSFIKEKPVYFFELLANKLWYLFSHFRPYYTNFHNALSLTFLIPAYFFATLGLPSANHDQRSLRMLLLSTVVCQALITAVTFTDWDGRFLIPLLYVVFLYAAIGFWRVLDHFLRR
jgi:hypothetical protein